MHKLAVFLDRMINPASRFVNSVGIFVLLFMMMINVLDVSLRFFLKAPIDGAYELTEFSMVVVVFFALAYTMIEKGHVGVDILVNHFPKKAQEIVSCCVYLISLGLFAIMTWQSILFAFSQWNRGVTSPSLYISVLPFMLIVSLGNLLISAVLLRDFLFSLGRILTDIHWKSGLALASGIIVALIMLLGLLFFQRMPVQIPPLTVGFIGIGLLIVLLFSGMPIGFVMALVGFIGITFLSGKDSSLITLGRVPYSTVASHPFSVLPLFILMGFFVYYSGISKELFDTANRWIGHFPGGLAMAAVGACAAFSAACGSSPATSATMGTLALPEMKKYNYDSGLATGSLAAGGTLGILIPPSAAFCVIGLIAELSIGKLFLAGILPGILLSVLFIISIFVMTRHNIALGPPAEKSTLQERLNSLKGTWGIIALFILVMGGIYTGIFTPTEAAGIGAFGALVFGLGRRKLSWKNFTDSLMGTGKMSAMIFTILFGAMIFGYFLTLTRLPSELAGIVSGFQVNRYVVLIIIIVVYVFLGCIMDVIAMTILTIPIIYPIITTLGFDPIWFGVIVVIVSELGLITPPVGINVYIIAGVAEDVPMFTIFRGIVPFAISMVVCLFILILFPQIALWLPNLLK